MANKNVVILGNFDGVHIAHQEIFLSARRIAKQNNAEVMVLTFDPHPRAVLSNNGHKMLTSLAERIALIKNLVQKIEVINFDANFAKTTAEEFIDILLDDYNAGWIVSGYDFYFGYRRQGSPKMLYESAIARGFQYHQVVKITQNGLDVSSSTIKNLLNLGAIGLVSEMLGRPYCIPLSHIEISDGIIILQYDHYHHYPVCGRYVAEIIINNQPWMGVLEIDAESGHSKCFFVDDGWMYNQHDKLQIVLHALLHPKRIYQNKELAIKQDAIDFNETRHFFKNLKSSA